MAKRTKKVGITGKYGTRYGSSLRKIVKKMEVSQHKKYQSPFCGATSLKRTGNFTTRERILSPFSCRCLDLRPNQQEDGRWCLGTPYPELPGCLHGYPTTPRSRRKLNCSSCESGTVCLIQIAILNTDRHLPGRDFTQFKFNLFRPNSVDNQK